MHMQPGVHLSSVVSDPPGKLLLSPPAWHAAFNSELTLCTVWNWYWKKSGPNIAAFFSQEDLRGLQVPNHNLPKECLQLLFGNDSERVCLALIALTASHRHLLGCFLHRAGSGSATGVAIATLHSTGPAHPPRELDKYRGCMINTLSKLLLRPLVLWILKILLLHFADEKMDQN